MVKYISEGWVQNGAYEKVGLAIENADVGAVRAALQSVDDSKGISGKSNLNEVKKNADGESRSIFEVAMDVFINAEPNKREAAFAVIQELATSDKVIKSTHSISEALVTLIEVLKTDPIEARKQRRQNLKEARKQRRKEEQGITIPPEETAKETKTITVLDPELKKEYLTKFEDLLSRLLTTNHEFQENLYKSAFFLDLVEDLKNKVDAKKFFDIVNVNTASLLEQESTREFSVLIQKGYINKDSISDYLAGEILNFYKTHKPSFTWEKMREVVGNKLTPDYIIERLSDAIKSNSKDEAEKLLEYYRAHKAEFAGKIIVSNADLKKSYEQNKSLFKELVETVQANFNTKVQEASRVWGTQNKTAFEAAIEMGSGKAILSSDDFKPSQDDPSTFKQLYENSKNIELFSLLLKKENAVSAAELKAFLAKAIKENHPEIALLLVEYYIRNEQIMKAEIGKNLLSTEDFLLVSSKSEERSWAALQTLIQASGATELDSKLIVRGYIYNSEKKGFDLFIDLLTPASLNIAIKNGDILPKQLTAEQITKIANEIAASSPQEFAQYLDVIRGVNENLLDEVVKLTINDINLIEVLGSKGLVKDMLKMSAIELYKGNKLLLLDILIDKKLIKLTGQDDKGNTLLHYAIANGHFRFAERIIAEVGKEKINDKILVQVPNKDGVTPLLQLLQQPYSKEKSSLMGMIMMTKGFKYTGEKIDKKIGHIISSIKDKDTAKDFLVYLEQVKTKNASFKERLVEIFTQALLTNNTAVTLAVLENYNSSMVNVNHVTYTDKKGKTYGAAPLFMAYMNGNVELIDKLLQNKKIDINKIGPNDLTLLHQAALDGQQKIVDKILKTSGVDPNLTTKVNKHPIFDVLAAIELFEAKPKLDEAEKKRLSGLKDTFDLLAASPKVNINAVDSKGNTPAIIMYKRIQSVSARIKQLEEIAAQKPKGVVDSMKEAVNSIFSDNANELAKLREYKKFLDSGFRTLMANPKVDLLVNNKDEQNIVILSIQNQDTETLEATIGQNKKGEKLNPIFNNPDTNGNTPILHAYATGNPEILRLTLLAAGGSPKDLEMGFKAINNDGQNILVAACKGGNLEMVKSAFAELDQKTVFTSDNLGNNFLHHASSKPEILSYLLAQDKENIALDAVNKDGQTPLVKAVLEGNTEAVKLLLDKGADVNLADKNGNTPLIYGCILNKPEIINALLARPELNIRKKNKAGATAYMHAAIQKSPPPMEGEVLNPDQMWTGNPEILKALISRGAEPVFGEYYKGIGEKMQYIAIEAAGTSLVGSITSRILGSDSITAQSIKITAASRAAMQTYKAVSISTEKSIKKLLSGSKTNSAEIDLENQCMIGAMSVGRFGRVYHGENLIKYLATQENFENAENSIYSNEQLKAKIEDLSKAQRAEFHETLQARYARIQTALASRFMPFWTRSTLNKIQKEILAADAEIFLKQDNTHISEKLKDTFSMLKGTARDRFIVGMLTTENNKEYKEFKQLLDDILKQKVYVPANVMYDALEFNKRYKQLVQQQKNPSLLRRVFGFTFLRSPDIKKTQTICNEARQPELRKFEVSISRDNLVPISKAGAGKENNIQNVGTAVTMLGNLTGQKPEDVANGIARACGKIAGIGSGVATYAIMDLDHVYKMSMIASTAGGVALSVAGVVSSFVKTAYSYTPDITPTRLAVGFGAAAIAVGGYMLYSRSGSKMAGKADGEQAFVPNTLADLSNPECKKDAAAKYLGEKASALKVEGIIPEAKLSAAVYAPSILDIDVSKQLPITRYDFAQQVLAGTSLAGYVESNKAIVDSKKVVHKVMEVEAEKDKSKGASALDVG